MSNKATIKDLIEWKRSDLCNQHDGKINIYYHVYLSCDSDVIFSSAEYDFNTNVYNSIDGLSINDEVDDYALDIDDKTLEEEINEVPDYLCFDVYILDKECEELYEKKIGAHSSMWSCTDDSYDSFRREIDKIMIEKIKRRQRRK